MSQNPNKSLDDILKLREERESIVSTEEALEIQKQEAIWKDEAKEETHIFNEIEDESPTKIFKALPADHVYA